MQFIHSEEQQLIREAARDLLGARADAAHVRAAMAAPGGYDADLWRQMSTELGWTGLAIPQSYGGAGLGWVELCILQEEQGRHLVASPFFATAALAAPLIEAAASETQRAELLGRIAAGEVRFGCALTGADGRPPCAAVTVVLEERGGRFSLNGVSDFVVHGDSADLLLVLARAPGSQGDAGISVAVIPAGSSGVSIHPHVMLDLTRPMSRVEFRGVTVSREQLLGEPGAAAAAVEQGLDLARIALAAEAVGGAEQVLEMTTAYAKERVQFGRPIGSFQAVKHRLADMMIEVEAAKSAAWYAASVPAEARGELAEAAATAKSYCCDAYFDCAANAVQLHGGIGFTWEHMAHLYFKRARATATLLGSPAWQRERLVRLIAGGAAAAPFF
ncbi:MAG TPA: acyl-CoA dehydrogenase family protein [Steroidobacteraceae bacterium]|nr:acyl-CoA dehydrogenase family protein [Steroidobacteraceae bacterium]